MHKEQLVTVTVEQVITYTVTLTRFAGQTDKNIGEDAILAANEDQDIHFTKDTWRVVKIENA